LFNKGDIVLIDTNVILEAHRVCCWKALSEYFSLHTVDKVIEETQTGYQNRKPEQTIDANLLKTTFTYIETISELQVIEFDLNAEKSLPLDDGEKALIIYAHTLGKKVWFLNSPDKAAIKYACKVGWGDNLVSLESMSTHLKLNLKHPLKQNYTSQWLSQEKIRFNQGIL
jgi:hypothetical protein